MAVYTLEIRIEGVDDLSPILQRAERDVDRAAQSIDSSLNRVERGLRNVAETGDRSMRTLSSRMDEVGGKMRRIGDRARPVGMALSAIGAVLLGPIGIGVAKFATFEQTMANVKAVSGATKEEFAALTDVARRLGETTRFTADEAAEGLTFMAMAGLNAQQMVEGLPRVLQLSSASGLELGESADILTNIMTAMGLQASELTRVNDVLVKGFTSSNTTLSELGQAFSFVAGMAKNAGLSVEETTAILSAFAGQGIKSSRGGTAMEAMLRMMTKVTPAAKKEMDRLGLSFADAEGNLKPMPTILRELDAAMQGIPGATERLRIIQIMFGEQGARGINALLQFGADNLEEFNRQLENAGGTAEKVSQIQLDTLSGSFTELKSAIEGTLISIGQRFAPAVERVVRAVTSAVRVFSNLPAPLQTTIVVSAAVVGALAALAGVILLLLAPVGLMVQGWAVVVPVVGVVMGALGALAGVITGTVIPAIGAFLVAIGPVGWVILAIAAIVGVFALAWAKNWFGMRDKVKAAVGFIVNFIKDNWQKIASIMAFFIGGPLAAFGVAWATNAFGIRDKIRGLVTAVRDFFTNLAMWMFDAGANILSGLWEGIKSRVPALLDGVRDIGEKVFNAMKEGMGRLWPFSPSEAGIAVGEGLLSGIVAGVNHMMPQLDRAMGKVGSHMGVAVPSGVGGGKTVIIQGPLVTFNNPVVRSDEDLRRLGEAAAVSVKRAIVGAM